LERLTLPLSFTTENFVMLYRAQDASGTSRLGYAESADWNSLPARRAPRPLAGNRVRKRRGVEDPRLQKFGDHLVPHLHGLQQEDAQLCLATSLDLIHWQRKGVILPAYQGNLERRVDQIRRHCPGKNRRQILDCTGSAPPPTRPTRWGSPTRPISFHWTEATNTPVLPRRPGKFDSRVVEPGPPPILTPRGILLVYNGADDKLVYRTGVAVFDRRHPRKLLSRSDTPIFAPEKDWEKVARYPNVVFVEGLVQNVDRFFFYYGGADKYIGVAEAQTK